MVFPLVASVRCACAHAGSGSFARSSQEITLWLDGGEVLRSVRQVRKCPVTASRICQGNDERDVQVSVGSKQFGGDGEAA